MSSNTLTDKHIRDAIKALQNNSMATDPNDIYNRMIQMQAAYGSPGSISPIGPWGGPSGRTFRFGSTELQIGSEVILIAMDQNRYGNPSDSNPLWAVQKRFITGKVTDFESSTEVEVTWSNGAVNTYNSRSARLAVVDDKILKQKADALKPKPVVINMKAFDALVLEDSTKEEIISVLKQFQNRDKMFDDWGLGEVIEYGKGMSFLFYGPPGTGKTWAAHCIAKATGYELLTIGSAEIQTSEPGGANRAIQAAFAEATKNGKVLFIDECDSLIGSRQDLGMILGSEVNTLLTEIEKFEGVCVLATNRISNLDEALERRISLIVEFPEPDQKQREAIWTKMLPKKMPLGKDVDITKLADHILTGGQIKNCVLSAARLALSTGIKEVNKDCFDAAIARVKASKNLMGSASRYRQITVREDFRKG